MTRLAEGEFFKDGRVWNKESLGGSERELKNQYRPMNMDQNFAPPPKKIL